jgi:hypothetical protein
MSDDYEQYREVARLQYEEIEKLRALVSQRDAELDALVAWIAGDAGALEALQSVYADPRTSTANKVKAATSAIGFEISKPASVTVIADFRGRVENARERTIELRRQEWARQEQPAELTSTSTILGGDYGPDPAA